MNIDRNHSYSVTSSGIQAERRKTAMMWKGKFGGFGYSQHKVWFECFVMYGSDTHERTRMHTHARARTLVHFR